MTKTTSQLARPSKWICADPLSTCRAPAPHRWLRSAWPIRRLRVTSAIWRWAGGVTLVLPQEKGYFHTEGGMLSRDGHCRTFDKDASGTVFSNAGAVILMKRESDAIADGDNIIAVIRGAALNNDGGKKLSYTAPSVQGRRKSLPRRRLSAELTRGLWLCGSTWHCNAAW